VDVAGGEVVGRYQPRKHGGHISYFSNHDVEVQIYGPRRPPSVTSQWDAKRIPSWNGLGGFLVLQRQKKGHQPILLIPLI